MTSKVYKRLTIFVLIVIALLSVFDIANNYYRKRKKESIISSYWNQKIFFPENESIFYTEKSKIIILVREDEECTKCMLQVYKWYIYAIDLDVHHYDADIIYVTHPGIIDKETLVLLNDYNLKISEDLVTLLRMNPILEDCIFSIFLLDKDNKIKALGNPIGNMRLWNVYKEAIKHDI